jgi:hypothetical protein
VAVSPTTSVGTMPPSTPRTLYLARLTLHTHYIQPSISPFLQLPASPIPLSVSMNLATLGVCVPCMQNHTVFNLSLLAYFTYHTGFMLESPCFVGLDISLYGCTTCYLSSHWLNAFGILWTILCVLGSCI